MERGQQKIMERLLFFIPWLPIKVIKMPNIASLLVLPMGGRKKILCKSRMNIFQASIGAFVGGNYVFFKHHRDVTLVKFVQFL